MSGEWQFTDADFGGTDEGSQYDYSNRTKEKPMSCPGTYVDEDFTRPGATGDEPYPGSNDIPSMPNTPPPSSQPDGYGSDPGDESEYVGGLGAQKLAQDTASGVYQGASNGTYSAGQQHIDPRAVPPKPIEEMSAREFLHFYSRNPQVTSSKRKTFASLITASDANYQAFIELVAFHLLNGDTDFMVRVMESGADEINEARQERLRAIFNLFSEVGR